MSVFQTVPACRDSLGKITTAKYLFNIEGDFRIFRTGAIPAVVAIPVVSVMPAVVITPNETPEPATVVLVALTFALFCWRRRWMRNRSQR